MKYVTNFTSPNSDTRPNGSAINFIILHYTEMMFDDALAKLCDPSASVSAHYLLKEDGVIYQLVDDSMRSWHAGKSYWKGIEALNNCSIGIEIDNLGDRAFSDAQIKSCIKLCKYLMKKYDIKPHNVLGHSDIAPDRKIDPGIFFDWRMLASQNIGLWPRGAVQTSKATRLSDYASVQSNLSKFGYKIDITGVLDRQTMDVIRAFQSRFCPHKIKSLDVYRDLNAIYEWDQESEVVLSELLSISSV